MLYIDPSEVEVIPTGPTTCACCKERKASWCMQRLGGDGREPLCGWCVMYGDSEWGKLNAGELVAAGAYLRSFALGTQRKGTLVPELDERHRLQPDDADRYVMGIVFSSRLLAQGPLGRLARVGERAHEVDEGP